MSPPKEGYSVPFGLLQASRGRSRPDSWTEVCCDFHQDQAPSAFGTSPRTPRERPPPAWTPTEATAGIPPALPGLSSPEAQLNHLSPKELHPSLLQTAAQQPSHLIVTPLKGTAVAVLPTEGRNRKNYTTGELSHGSETTVMDVWVFFFFSFSWHKDVLNC